MDEQTNYEAVKKIDWAKVNSQILNDENKTELLRLILKMTGIEFKTLTAEIGKDPYPYPTAIGTESVRPEMGVVGRWIEKFAFGLYHREPVTNGDRVYLSYCPSLGYSLLSGGRNGFEIDRWFYYDCQINRWYIQ